MRRYAIDDMILVSCVSEPNAFVKEYTDALQAQCLGVQWGGCGRIAPVMGERYACYLVWAGCCVWCAMQRCRARVRG